MNQLANGQVVGAFQVVRISGDPAILHQGTYYIETVGCARTGTFVCCLVSFVFLKLDRMFSRPCG